MESKAPGSKVTYSNLYGTTFTAYNQYLSHGKTYQPLYVYYLPTGYYNPVGYYSPKYFRIYFNGYGYNFYYGAYGYYQDSLNDKEPLTGVLVKLLVIVIFMAALIFIRFFIRKKKFEEETLECDASQTIFEMSQASTDYADSFENAEGKRSGKKPQFIMG